MKKNIQVNDIVLETCKLNYLLKKMKEEKDADKLIDLKKTTDVLVHSLLLLLKQYDKERNEIFGDIVNERIVSEEDYNFFF